jgi:predicted DsbA family dithiol-disulfide isomerase
MNSENDSAAPHKTLFPMRWFAFSILALLLFAGGWLLRGWRQNPARSSGGKVVAAIGSELLYEKDYTPPPQAQIQKIRSQEYELQRRALETAIDKRLLRAEAAKRGVNDDELLSQEADSRVPEPEDSEVEQVWAQQLFQRGGQITESKDDLRKQLKQEQTMQAREEFFRGLREKAGVKIYLLPPAVEVGFDASRVRGNPAAKITMVEFSDFHCPFCRQAYSEVKNLLKEYDGKVKVAYRDLPLIEAQEQNQVSAAEASRCAGEQGKFWEYHDLLFENQSEYGPEGFQDFAKSLGLNLDKFGQCLDTGKFKAQVKEDFQEAVKLGAVGTPYFFVNGVPISGARPQKEFEAVIDAQLANLGQ